ncbi:phosphotransferase [Paenibacillus sp. UNC499MF]|uniref:phosphotransferase n=1 Tax=Paenibacillus sp. UNC499MF TaxID=1502751 RepID=UPI00089FB06C|nr:phosphotransferase [Paenibacillus sp. UNC499MF]SEG72180.1 Phosphotransferase enzyme family protein [Paenibacillus sp. UNC499MF]
MEIESLKLARLAKLVAEHYLLEPLSINRQQGGWASLAYRIETSSNSTYFLKEYEKKRSSTPKLTAMLDTYIPVTCWLNENTNLAGKITVPLKTQSGEYVCENVDGIFLLYEYIHGETIGKKALNQTQIEQLSTILAELHKAGDSIPVPVEHLTEDFQVSFVYALGETMASRHTPPRFISAIKPYENVLLKQVSILQDLSLKLVGRMLPLRWCHTDIHPWNMMQSDQQLILIDWEGVKLAPVEADLMFLTDESYFHDFFALYKKIHPNYILDEEALRFYKIRRLLEDIWEFTEQFLYDEQNESEKEETLRQLIHELEALKEYVAPLTR